MYSEAHGSSTTRGPAPCATSFHQVGARSTVLITPGRRAPGEVVDQAGHEQLGAAVAALLSINGAMRSPSPSKTMAHLRRPPRGGAPLRSARRIERLAARGMAAEEWVALGANLFPFFNFAPPRIRLTGSARSSARGEQGGKHAAAEPCIAIGRITCSPSCVRPPAAAGVDLRPQAAEVVRPAIEAGDRRAPAR